MIVRGFIEPIARELPMEYAMELNKLIEMGMEGVGRLDDGRRHRHPSAVPTTTTAHAVPGVPHAAHGRQHWPSSRSRPAPSVRARSTPPTSSARPAARSTGSTRRSPGSLRCSPTTPDADGVMPSRSSPSAAARAARPCASAQAPRGEVFDPEDLPSAIAWTQGEHAAAHPHPARTTSSPSPSSIGLHGTGAASRHAHVVIEAPPNSRATVLLRAHGHGRVRAERRDHRAATARTSPSITVQQWDDDAVHAASHQARVERDATLRHFVVSFGGGVVRVNPSVELAGAGSRRASCTACRYADAGQHLESQVYLHHKGPQTTGDVLYKGALQGVGRAQRLDRRRADRTGCRRHRLVRGQPQPGAHRRCARRLDPEPRDRDGRHPRRRSRERDRSLRRRAAVLPAGARHQRGRGPPPGRARLPQRDRAAASAFPASRTSCIDERSRRELAGRSGAVTATRVCALSELEQDTAIRVEVDGVAIAVVLDRQRRGPRHRRRLHARRHLALRGLRRRRHARVLGPRLGVLAAHRQAPQPPRL